MSDDPSRRSNGQFQAGVSGNSEGARRRRPARLLTVEDLHRAQLEVASKIVTHPATGEKMSRFDLWVRSLASGTGKNRLGLKDSIEMTKSAAYFFERLRQRAEDEDRRRRAASKNAF